MKQFIVDDDAFTKQKAKPEDFLAESNRDIILTYHNGFNMFTPEGLFAWQHNVLDWVCDHMRRWKSGKSSALNMNARKELKVLQNESKQVLMSADISSWLSLYRFQACFNLIFKAQGSSSQMWMSANISQCK